MASPSLRQRALRFYRQEIWRMDRVGGRPLRRFVSAVLRVISITLTGINETKAFSRAAALSFSTLLGLGPLVAITVLVAGFVLDRSDPQAAARTLNQVIQFAAPQIGEWEQIDAPAKSPPPTDDPGEAAEAPAVEPPPGLTYVIEGFIQASQSSAAGVVGTVTLIVIVLQLFTSVENAFNEIWGVRRGRSWVMRVVYYWTVITLGAVLFFTIITAVSAGAFLNLFAETIPFGLGPAVIDYLKWALPALSLLLLVGVLTLFYRCIPNTRVLWRAAFTGALVVAALVVANNYLAFLYLSKVVQQKSFYGSLGIIPILMFGMYIFWLFLLLGGQLSYAVQNVQFRNSQVAWDALPAATRERLSLAVLLDICRRFHACRRPCTVAELGTSLRVPSQIINESLNRLLRMNLVVPTPGDEEDPDPDVRYLPARPLNRISLSDFKHLAEHLGTDDQEASLGHLDPILARYNQAIEELTASKLLSKPLDELIAENPLPGAK